MSRKRSIRGKSNHGSILRQTCRYYLRGTVRERLVNSVKMKRVVRLETSVAKNAVAIVKSVSQLVCVHKIQMHSFLKVESLGETRCRKSWHLFKGSDSLSLRYVMRVSGKRKDHRLEKYKSKFLISEVPYAMKFEDRSHEETERQQRCARSKAWNLAKNMHKFKEKQGCIPFSRGGMGTPGCVNKRAGGKIVCS